MKAIYLKELKSFFNSMIGYVFCAVLVILIGIYFMAQNLVNGYPYFSFALRSCVSIMMFAMPLLTMRSFAEERKSKTDQMLLTNPVKIHHIVIGKFLSYATIYAIPVVFSCICPLIIKWLGGTSYLKIDYISIFFTFIYGLVFIAIGMFISSLTESQIIAAVLSFAAVFIIVMWDALTNFIPKSNIAALITLLVFFAIICAIIYGITKSGFATGITAFVGTVALLITYFIKASVVGEMKSSILEGLNLGTPLTNVMYDYMFDLSGLIMYISIIFVFIVFTVQSIHKRRWN